MGCFSPAICEGIEDVRRCRRIVLKWFEDKIFCFFCGDCVDISIEKHAVCAIGISRIRLCETESSVCGQVVGKDDHLLSVILRADRHPCPLFLVIVGCNYRFVATFTDRDRNLENAVELTYIFNLKIIDDAVFLFGIDLRERLGFPDLQGMFPVQKGQRGIKGEVRGLNDRLIT